MESNEAYPPSAPRPAGTGTMKTFLSLILVFLIAQVIGTVLFGLYLHMKLDKVGDELSLQEDITFLRRLQKCQNPEDQDTTLLDCAKILSRFQNLVRPQVPQESALAKQTGDKRPSATIHLAGLKDKRKILQWRKSVYAPADETFSYQEGKITVAKGGRYYIYSQVAFCTKQAPHAPFNVYIYLNLPAESDQLLLKGVGTHGESDDLCGLQSIHLGRAVELQEGHVVFVSVTDSSRVNYDNGNTYFGMFELS
ncbi:hypothetical protein lerEdw1_004000 [Lerista edwardsae]|nr:hypothetical protein lerEdw1_004003 [Lerista edwardsae]KAJ6650783.1 hypothetical protein lerEdw1_004000 [Lerista edwardsae]